MTRRPATKQVGVWGKANVVLEPSGNDGKDLVHDTNVSRAQYFSLKPQDIVKAHAEKWRTIWHRFLGQCGAPWRMKGDVREHFSWMPPKRKLVVDDIFRAGSCFKDRTGRGLTGSTRCE